MVWVAVGLLGAGACALIVLLAVVTLGIDPVQGQKLLQSDGVFGNAVVHALSAVSPGTVVGAGVLIVAGSCLWFLHRHWRRGSVPHGAVWVPSLVALQVLVGIVCVFALPTSPRADFAWYHEQAAGLAAGRGVVTRAGEPTAYWPIGYAAILSFFYRLFGASLHVAQVVNVFVIGAITALTYLLAGRMFDQRRAVYASLLIAALPSQVLWCLLPNTDLLFALICLALICLVGSKLTWPTVIASGVLFGVGTLCRPILVCFPLVVAVFWILRGERWVRVLPRLAALVMVGALVLVPWQVRNYRAFGQFVLVSNNGGVNLWMGNNPMATGAYLDPDRFIPAATWNWMQSLNEAEQDKLCMREGCSYILRHPLRALGLWPRKIAHLLLRDGKAVTYPFLITYNQLHPVFIMALLIVVEGSYYALGLGCLVGFIKLVRREQLTPRTWLLGGTIIYFILIHLPFIADGRYHLPLLPIFALLAVSNDTSQRQAVSAV